MKKKKIALDEVTALSKEMFHSYFSGDMEHWFSHLCSESLYMGTGEPMLFGGDAITRHFEGRATTNPVEIVQEEYFPLALSDDTAQVCGQIIIQSEDSPYRAVTYFTIGYRLVSGEIKLLYQHNSYQFLQTDKTSKINPIGIDIRTTQFVRDLLLDRTAKKTISYAVVPTLFLSTLI